MALLIGIDWSQAKHDLCFLNEAGAVLTRLTIAHSADGFARLEAEREKLGFQPSECRVALETAHNLLVDFLWGHGYSQVYVIPPSVVKSTRRRYNQSGARTDQSDAFLLSDLLRTDGARFQPWRPDTCLTRQIRSQVSWVLSVAQTVREYSQRLRAVLERYYPAAVELFSGLDTQIALEFVCFCATPQRAAQLSRAEFETFTQQHHYRPQRLVTARLAHLQQAYPQADETTVTIFAPQALHLATALLPLVQTKATALRDLQVLFQQHPDAPIFASLPGAGDLLAPALLAQFGDDRARFPTPASVQALAGTCPVTDASGKHRAVYFRRACDRAFRVIVQHWAKASLTTSSWAQAYWQQVYARCHSKSQAYRCLANRWLAIAWKLWQTRQPYREAYHLQQRARRSQPRRS